MTSSSGNLTLTERSCADPSWLSDLILDLEKGNWFEWSRRLSLLADRLLVSGYLNGTLRCPDPVAHPTASQVWEGNDRSLRAFMLERMTPGEYEFASDYDTSHMIFEALRVRHEKLGLHAQIHLLLKEFTIFYEPSVPMTATSKQLRTLHVRMKKMGKIDEDKLFLFVIINALGRHYHQLQSEIHRMTDDPSFDWMAAFRRIETEAALAERRAEISAGSTTTTTIALATLNDAKDKLQPVVICSNCKRPHHTIEFCVKQGGKMAGRSLEEAKATQRAAAGKPPRPTRSTQSANVASTTTPSSITLVPTTSAATAMPTTPTTAGPSPSTAMVSALMTAPTPIVINGISYFPAPSSTSLIPQTANVCDHTGFPYGASDLLNFRAFIAADDVPPKASLNWANYSKATDLGDAHAHITDPPSLPFLAMRLEEYPFVLDTGATCHISPERSDFQVIRPIQPHPIKGLGGACIYAVGVGSIELAVGNDQRLLLHNALFAPASSVRLISVLSLNRDSKSISCFDEKTCWIIDKQSGNTIAQGIVSPTRNLYTVASFDPKIIPSSQPNRSMRDTGFYASRVPDVETWHRRLGHCNTRTIIDMARTNVVKGMPINLSTTPPKCDHCILGKQARTSVPNLREGLKATRRLERVFVDLCGLMSVTSKSGQLYAMNIIDDYSSYVWTIPLRSKDEAAQALQFWHRAVENQSGERLKIVVSDNGELLSHSVANWCTEHGIEHLLTAPYTSAHNGRAERLHRTLLDKARTMRLTCNAPASL